MAKKETQVVAPQDVGSVEDTGLVAVPPATALADLSRGMVAPDFVYEDTDQDFGLSEVSKYIIPPRIKTVQSQSTGDFKEKFNVGDLVMTPDMVRIFEMPYAGTKVNAEALKDLPAFQFAPLFFYVEWATWNDIKFRGSRPAIVERTTDPKSPIAQKAKNPAMRKEPYPADKAGGEKDVYYRHIEHLNYVVLLLDVEGYEDTPVVLTFSRSEHRSGTNFNALLRRRRCPIYAGQYEARMGYRTNAQGEWWGIDVANPTKVPPFVENRETFEMRRSMFEDLKQAHEEQRIQVSYDDDDAAPVTGGGESEF